MEKPKHSKPLSWYRDKGFEALLYAAAGMLMASMTEMTDPILGDRAQVYFFWIMGVMSIVTSMLGVILLFTWWTLRNDPDYN